MKKRKAINFDLSTKELQKHFKNTAEAYNQIKNFMLKNGFEHRQYSGYASIEPMNERQVAKIAKLLNNNFSWLSSCIQEFDVTDIGEQYSLRHIFKEDKNLSKTKDITTLKEKSTKEASEEQIKVFQEKVKKASQNLKLTENSKNKDRDLDR